MFFMSLIQLFQTEVDGKVIAYIDDSGLIKELHKYISPVSEWLSKKEFVYGCDDHLERLGKPRPPPDENYDEL